MEGNILGKSFAEQTYGYTQGRSEKLIPDRLSIGESSFPTNLSVRNIAM
jgi:hypothetical protein